MSKHRKLSASEIEAARIAKQWPDFPYSTEVDIVNEAKPKRYCGIHHTGFYGDCEICLLKVIAEQMVNLYNHFKWPLGEENDPVAAE